MAAPKVADYYSLSPGHDGEQADAEMAYTQAEFHGPTTWVGIPKEQWPSNWYDAKGKPKYRFPVCKLMKALYVTRTRGVCGRSIAMRICSRSASRRSLVGEVYTSMMNFGCCWLFMLMISKWRGPRRDSARLGGVSG